MNGYCGIGIYYPKNQCNIGGLFRSALAFNSNFVFTIGKKYKRDSSDTPNTIQHIPYFNYTDKEEFLNGIPKGCLPVVIEITDKAWDLKNFVHPQRAVYILGHEGGGLPKEWLNRFPVVKINTSICLNVCTAGSIILYDRSSKTDRYKSRIKLCQ